MSPVLMEWGALSRCRWALPGCFFCPGPVGWFRVKTLPGTWESLKCQRLWRWPGQALLLPDAVQRAGRVHVLE